LKENLAHGLALQGRLRLDLAPYRKWHGAWSRGYLIIGDCDEPEQKWGKGKDEMSVDERVSY
jgi:hypothetical protein